MAAPSDGSQNLSASTDDQPSRGEERLAFIATTFVIIPGLTVAFVGAFGLIVWILQLINGPPGPPG